MNQNLNLEQFIAFNEELSAMAEAKIPIPLGLKNLGSNQPKALKQISLTIGNHIENGKTLPEAIKMEKDQFPPMYYNIVEAGLRSGNLSTALESVSAFSWDFLKIRKSLFQAMIYPVIVVILAYSLFILFLAFFVTIIESTYQSLGATRGLFINGLSMLSANVAFWFWIPLLVILIVFIGLFKKQVSGYGLGSFSFIFACVPGMKGIIKDYSYSTFTEVLSMLIAHKTPMAESLKLAAESTGNQNIIQSVSDLTAELELGKSLDDIPNDKRLPEYLWFLITQGYRESTFSDSLKRAANMYRTRALDRSESIQFKFPIYTTVLIGGTTVLIYALCLFIPLIDLYKKVSLIG